MPTSHTTEKVKAARLSIISNSALVILKLVVGTLMGSVAVLSEAIHSGLDLLASLIAYYAVGKAGKPADERHPYGHGKWENVSGVIEALLILAAAAYIVYEAVIRLMHGSPIGHLGLGTAVMAISALVNWVISRRLFAVARKTHSIALEADAWHLRIDVYTSVGVVAGLGLIALTNLTWLDSVAALIVALLIVKSSMELVMKAMGDIFDTRIPVEDEAKIHEVLSRYKDSFVDFHRLRSRKSGSVKFIDLHVAVPRKWTVDEAHILSDELERDILAVLPNTQVIIHIDPCSKVFENCPDCSLACNGTKSDQAE
jgi:cation diffusion facilitator family transporter